MARSGTSTGRCREPRRRTRKADRPSPNSATASTHLGQPDAGRRQPESGAVALAMGSEEGGTAQVQPAGAEPRAAYGGGLGGAGDSGQGGGAGGGGLWGLEVSGGESESGLMRSNVEFSGAGVDAPARG